MHLQKLTQARTNLGLILGDRSSTSLQTLHWITINSVGDSVFLPDQPLKTIKALGCFRSNLKKS
ncbi:hypothetical protein NC652_015576 [Populus alba x Populus x berolinensis]|nr:hypothetical protein NC652_015576 [Populus alba x Populus x berolinensis]